MSDSEMLLMGTFVIHLVTRFYNIIIFYCDLTFREIYSYLL